MITSPYIPIKKKDYISKLVKLGAENKALRKKLAAYEDILKTKIAKPNVPKIADVIDYPTNIQNDAKTLFFKQTAITYIQSPDTNHNLVTPLVKHMMMPYTESNVNKQDIHNFLEYF